MGKVRVSKVKIIARKLVETFPNTFTTDFNTNKQLVCKYTNIRSKHLRNRVAGYITRILARKKKLEESKTSAA
ncbi:MAG: 30S ribosomal protein S17e [Candidatus Verstraetearchaeota archaeon]|jgi:small subunit ribosomal protein S17e|nr:30S ribosomal protein S17e [Candidatus Verstraetearchaeota archaeon]